MVQASSTANTVVTLTINELMAANANVTREAAPYVTCPVDPLHRMPRHRLQWHLINRCKKAQAVQHLLMHCPNDFSHVFLERGEFDRHVQACNLQVSSQQQVNNETVGGQEWEWKEQTWGRDGGEGAQAAWGNPSSGNAAGDVGWSVEIGGAADGDCDMDTHHHQQQEYRDQHPGGITLLLPSQQQQQQQQQATTHSAYAQATAAVAHHQPQDLDTVLITTRQTTITATRRYVHAAASSSQPQHQLEESKTAAAAVMMVASEQELDWYQPVYDDMNDVQLQQQQQQLQYQYAPDSFYTTVRGMGEESDNWGQMVADQTQQQQTLLLNQQANLNANGPSSHMGTLTAGFNQFSI